MNRRTIAALAGVATLTIAAAPATAQTVDSADTVESVDSTVEPTSEAGATAVEVEGVATISGTSATRDGEGSGSATATVLEVGGETIVGGTQEGEGSSGGEIVTTGEDNEQGYLTVGGWTADVDGTSSHSRSAVADGNLGGDEGASVSVLESESNAEDGHADAETTGVTVDLGGGQLHLELLHASTASDGTGESWILMANDEKILTSEQADGQCEIPADPVAHLLCLYAEATAGEDGAAAGATGATAGVADFTALDENLAGGLFTAGSSQAPAGDDAGEDTGVSDGSTPAGGEDVLAAPAGSLPRTGGGILTMLAGVLSMGAGAGLRRFTKA